METLFIYSLKVSIAITLFYVVYMLLLRKDTFFKWRRAYFLFALLFSLVFPFVQFSFNGGDNGTVIHTPYLLSELEIFVDKQLVSERATAFSFLSLLMYMALFGIAVFASRMLIQLGGLYYHLRSKEWLTIRDLKLHYLEKDIFSSFSFFHWIVINTAGQTDKQIKDILKHESVHANQLHSIDVLLYEVFCVFFWWNPLAWLMKTEMKLNLEYLADAGVLNTSVNSKEYQYTLLQINMANTGMAFINNFNVSHLKKRIIMMNRERTSIFMTAKLLMIVPLVVALVMGNALYAGTNSQADVLPQETDKKVFEVVEQMPEYPGGIDAMMRFISENLGYPQGAQDAGAEGRIIIRFVVNANGEISDVTTIGESNIKIASDEIVAVGTGAKEVAKKITKEEATQLMRDESIRVVKAMPKWEPGKQNGEIVAVYFNLPIMFRLKKDK